MFYILKRNFFQIYRIIYTIYCANFGANDVMRKMRKMWNWAQLTFVARKMRKLAPTRKPVALETLHNAHRTIISERLRIGRTARRVMIQTLDVQYMTQSGILDLYSITLHQTFFPKWRNYSFRRRLPLYVIFILCEWFFNSK